MGYLNYFGFKITEGPFLVLSKFVVSLLILMASLTLISGCGGSSGNQLNDSTDIYNWSPRVFHSENNFANKCISPRLGINPLTGSAYTDIQGSLLDENNWLRSWSNRLYLWYNEIQDQDPAGFSNTEDYFQELKTFSTTAGGRPKDQFHFSVPTDEYLQQLQSGVSAGYGFSLVVVSNIPPRQYVVSYTEPNSPATSDSVNLQRGTKIIEVDGYDLENTLNPADEAPLIAGLFPQTVGETHTFKVKDVGSETTRTVTMTSEIITSQPVQNTKTVETAAGKVGYLVFNAHIGTAEEQLIDAMTQFENESIDELVLDLRYNGGGALYIALELGSMIASREIAEGKVVGTLKYNDKNTNRNQSFPFLTHTPSYSPNPGRELPSLNLSRVFVLTGPNTCSASESIINGLRGVDLEVVQIGDTTCGKPYGFNPEDNCGTTYSSINFSVVNAKDFGDYADGFSPVEKGGIGVQLPGCYVLDDFTRQLGDTTEQRFSTALYYIENNSCPSASTQRKQIDSSSLNSVEGELIKPVWLKNMMFRNKP